MFWSLRTLGKKILKIYRSETYTGDHEEVACSLLMRLDRSKQAWEEKKGWLITDIYKTKIVIIFFLSNLFF